MLTLTLLRPLTDSRQLQSPAFQQLQYSTTATPARVSRAEQGQPGSDRRESGGDNRAEGRDGWGLGAAVASYRVAWSAAKWLDLSPQSRECKVSAGRRSLDA